jgi:hypothetical protein
MMKRTTFLIAALLLLILANVLMMATASPAFLVTGEGFVGHMARKQATGAAGEGFSNYASSAAGAKDHYVKIGAFDGLTLETGTDSKWRATAPNEPLRGPKVELGEDNLFIFKNNQCKPECCGASYSCDGGCVCTTPDQREMINTRGGNRTRPESGV